MSRKTRSTILVVEDDEPLLHTISQRLQCESFVAILASTFEQGAGALVDEDIQLLIADIVLPDGDGQELAASAQADGIPAICMTGLPERPFYEMSCITLEKPFRGTELLDAIRHALSECPVS